jgi:hypothetical protein
MNLKDEIGEIQAAYPSTISDPPLVRHLILISIPDKQAHPSMSIDRLIFLPSRIR